MKRIEFLKHLLLGVAGLSIPGLSIAANSGRKNKSNAPAQLKYVRLINFYIAGYQYHQGRKIEHLLKPRGVVAMKREPQNHYDHNAIALYFEDAKIGYVPSVDNEILSNMLDNNIALQARVASVNPTYSTWERVELDVLCCTGHNNVMLLTENLVYNNTNPNAN